MKRLQGQKYVRKKTRKLRNQKLISRSHAKCYSIKKQSTSFKMSVPQDININEPRFPQTTYMNRARHFLIVTNPLVSVN